MKSVSFLMSVSLVFSLLTLTSCDSPSPIYSSMDEDKNSPMYVYKLAAEQGDYTVQYNLGVMYSTGRDAAKDEQQAVHWFIKSAEQGVHSILWE